MSRNFCSIEVNLLFALPKSREQSWSQHFLRPSYPPGSTISIIMLAYPDHLELLTPGTIRDTLVYSARGEIPEETSCPAQEA